jgi:hypothetical protein
MKGMGGGGWEGVMGDFELFERSNHWGFAKEAVELEEWGEMLGMEVLGRLLWSTDFQGQFVLIFRLVRGKGGVNVRGRRNFCFGNHRKALKY